GRPRWRRRYHGREVRPQHRHDGCSNSVESVPQWRLVCERRGADSLLDGVGSLPRGLRTVEALGAGVDLTGAYDFSPHAVFDSRAVRLSLPLSIRWGAPSRLSLTPYVAPYGEFGHGRIVHADCHQFTCTGPA